MGREKIKRRELENESKVVLKNIRVSPQKHNLVVQMIRKESASKAISILQFSKRRISGDILKILKSAISNAENNHHLDIDKLILKEASVGKSMVLKRFSPRARGRAGKILKTFSRIRILVQERDEPEEKKQMINKKTKEDNGTKN